jgi:hypothetical protein
VQARSANPLRALTKDPAISSATASIVPSDRVMHHRAALAWCSATPIQHTRPYRDDLILLPSCLSRPAALLGCPPFAGFLPRTGEAVFLSASGPRVVLAALSPRLVFVGCLCVSSASTSGLRSRLRSNRQLRCRSIDPALGFASCRFADAMLRIRMGSTPVASSASGIPLPACHANRASLSARGLAAFLRRPFSVLMGLMPWPA